MSTLTYRPFTGPDDLQAMIALTQNLRAAGQKVSPIAADLYEEMADEDTQASARLWENEQKALVGFVYVSRYQNLVSAFADSEFTPAIEDEMFAWAETAMRQRNQKNGQEQTLDVSALDSNLAYMAMLEQRGFTRQAESSILLGRSLLEPIPAPELPAGFTIRPLRGEAEIEAYVALWRAAFDTENMSVEYRRTIMSAPDFIPALDLVAVAPNGDLAAFCVGQIFPDDAPRAGGTKEGWVDPVGTHPNYQRLGLAKALMLHGMRLLKERGIDMAILGTSNENIAMQRTAKSVGFQVVSNTLFYSKAV